MVGVIGIVVVFAMVFGGYLAAGGKMGIILKPRFTLPVVSAASYGEAKPNVS